MSAVELLRHALFGITPARSRRRPSKEMHAVARLLASLGKIGGNINQMAKPAALANFFAETRESIDYAVRNTLEYRSAHGSLRRGTHASRVA